MNGNAIGVRESNRMTLIVVIAVFVATITVVGTRNDQPLIDRWLVCNGVLLRSIVDDSGRWYGIVA